MPLRDHFHPPLSSSTNWPALLAAWPAVIVIALDRVLPPDYVASPRVHRGLVVEDAASHETGEARHPASPTANASTTADESDATDTDEYAVYVRDVTRQWETVAAVQIVSPANKDRPQRRRAFVAKCAALLQQGVSVAIVDVVTTRQFNLYGDLLELIGHADPSLTPDPPPVYAAACRLRGNSGGEGPPWQLEAWAHALTVGQPLPTLPLWLADELAVPLELEATYQETCHVLRMT